MIDLSYDVSRMFDYEALSIFEYICLTELFLEWLFVIWCARDVQWDSIVYSW